MITKKIYKNSKEYNFVIIRDLTSVKEYLQKIYNKLVVPSENSY